MEIYDYMRLKEMDAENEIKTAEKKGLQKGLQKGKQEGKVEVILEMYDDGFPVEKIARLVKMTVQDVNHIIDKQLKSRP